MPIVSAAHARMGSDPNISFKAASRNSPPSEQSKPKSGEEHRAHLDSAQELPCALLFVFKTSQKAPNQAACCKLPFISQAPPRNPEARLYQPRKGLDLVLLTRESIHASREKGWMLREGFSLRRASGKKGKPILLTKVKVCTKLGIGAYDLHTCCNKSATPKQRVANLGNQGRTQFRCISPSHDHGL